MYFSPPKKIIQTDRIQRFENVCKILRSMNHTFDRQISFLDEDDNLNNLNLKKKVALLQEIAKDLNENHYDNYNSIL